MQVNYTLFSTGYCSHIECVTIKGGKWCTEKFPTICALIQHPIHGNILFDTGHSLRFFKETQKWPLKFYQKIVSVHIKEEQTLSQQLLKKGIKPNEINYIIVSHFHADHIAGIKDFPKAKIICSKLAFDAVKDTKGIASLQKGFVRGLLPSDFESRLLFLENTPFISLTSTLHPFTEGIDIFGDNSLIAISLPGHAKGQYGLLFKDLNHQEIFLIADSCWSSKAYRDYKLPSFVTYLIHDHKNEYQETILKLHQLYKQNKHIYIIPSHCQEVLQQLQKVAHA